VKPGRFADTTPLTEAQQALVASHAAWADAGARKHAYRWRRWLSEDDLRSAAYMGLILAARKFDPARGLKFKTLAFSYCESLMRREVDWARKLDGAVFDARVKGGMRVVKTKADWPMYPDGTPQDIATVPANQFQATHLAVMRARLRSLVSEPADQALVDALSRHDSLRAAAAEIGLTPRGLEMRIKALAARVRPRLQRAA
jgi:hypothetical protein